MFGELSSVPILTHTVTYQHFLQDATAGPGWCGSADWVPACKLKGCRFDSQSGHIPRLWVLSAVRAHTEATDCCFSLTSMFLSLSLSLSLPLFLKTSMPSVKIFLKKPVTPQRNYKCFSGIMGKKVPSVIWGTIMKTDSPHSSGNGFINKLCLNLL